MKYTSPACGPALSPAQLRRLLTPGGRIVITHRDSPPPPDRSLWPVNAAELARLGQEFGLSLRSVSECQPDGAGRAEVFEQMAIRELPDDGAGALLLRGEWCRKEEGRY